MAVLIDFKTGNIIKETPLSMEDQFIKDLIFIMSSATTEEAIKESLFSKYNVSLKK